MSASKRAAAKICESFDYTFTLGTDERMASVIAAEYAPLVKAARDALVEMSWALHNKYIDAPGLFEQRRTALRSALAHIEGDATP